MKSLLISLASLSLVAAADPWPTISTRNNFRVDFDYYSWAGDNSTVTQRLPDNRATWLVNADGGRMRTIVHYRYGVYGIVSLDTVVDFKN